jgi:hypothetical protein
MPVRQKGILRRSPAIQAFAAKRKRLPSARDAQPLCSARMTERATSMTQRLHLVFGGELVDPQKTVFRDPDAIHIVGIYPDYAAAHAAWKGAAQRTVDNAHMRYFIADISKLRETTDP